MPNIYTLSNSCQFFDIFQATMRLSNIWIDFFTDLITPQI
jgi:hypothetical protein